MKGVELGHSSATHCAPPALGTASVSWQHGEDVSREIARPASSYRLRSHRRDGAMQRLGFERLGEKRHGISVSSRAHMRVRMLERAWDIIGWRWLFG